MPWLVFGFWPCSDKRNSLLSWFNNLTDCEIHILHRRGLIPRTNGSTISVPNIEHEIEREVYYRADDERAARKKERKHAKV